MVKTKEIFAKLILEKRKIKPKVMNMKIGVIDAELSFNETFKQDYYST